MSRLSVWLRIHGHVGWLPLRLAVRWAIRAFVWMRILGLVLSLSSIVRAGILESWSKVRVLIDSEQDLTCRP